jgi:hypothetical protein
MQNEYDLQNVEDFKINPHVWLQTLLAIAGDKQKKKEVIHTVSQQSGMSPEKVEILINKAINVLITDTRSN